MAKPPSTASNYTVLQRKRLSEAVLQGYCDAALLSHADAAFLTGHVGEAEDAGYIADRISDSGIQNTPVNGVNRP